MFLGQTLLHSLTPPIKGERVLRQTWFIGWKSMLVIALTGTFTGMVVALQGFPTLRRVGSEALLGPMVSLSLIRELGPVLTALMVTGRAGSAIAAEIGIMRTSEQINALELMGLNPLRYVVVPNVLASLLALPVLTVVFDVIGILGGYLVGVRLLGLNGGTYFGEMSNYVGDEGHPGRNLQGPDVWPAHRLGVLLQRIPQPVRGRRRQRGYNPGRGQCLGAHPGLRLLCDFGCFLGRGHDPSR